MASVLGVVVPPGKSYLQGAQSAAARSKFRRPEGGVGDQVILRAL